MKHNAPIAIGYIALLIGVNAYVSRDIFFAEYTTHTNSIQGLWISMARLAGEHWYRPAWWPFQDAGVPFEHTYMPLVPASTALCAKVAHCSPARAFHIVMGIVYCLGPVTLFLMAWRMSQAPGYAFWAALAYSLTSPARALIREGDFALSRFWTSLRLYTTIVWDDLPHYTALCFLPLVILFLWRSFHERRPAYYLLAILSMALTMSASVFGSVGILLSVVCMFFALPRERLRANLRLVLTLGGLAYLLICPFLPPSLIATIRSNQQRFPEDRWSISSIAALGVVVLGWILLRRVSVRWKDGYLRFFALLAFAAAAIPLLDAYLNLHFVPQPNRYYAEMEMGLALVVVFLIGRAMERLPRNIRFALVFLLACIAAEQLANMIPFARMITRSVDITRKIEWRVAQWVDARMPGQRVMVPGSIAQWFNVFSTTPQLSGASYATTPNWTQQDAMNSVLRADSPEKAEIAVLWLKAFGVQAVTGCGPRSSEFWKANNPKKFETLLPPLWQEEDTTIFRIPQRSSSLAHVIPKGAIPQKGSAPVLPLSELRKYVAALDDESLPLADMRWDGFRHIHIRTAAYKDHVVSVQTGYHPGWHARANGRAAGVRRDGLGFLLIQPQCDGPCEIELNYDGGWEYKLCRLLSLMTVAGLLIWSARRVRRSPVP